jgi:cullin 1
MMQDEFQRLLDNEKEDDLNRMYNLLNRIPQGLDPLVKRFEAHVKKAGLDSVEQVVGTEDADFVCSLSTCPNHLFLTRLEQEPKQYVDALLAVHEKNSDLVVKAFKGDAGFNTSLDKVSWT